MLVLLKDRAVGERGLLLKGPVGLPGGKADLCLNRFHLSVNLPAL